MDAGLNSSAWQHMDDTCTRVHGKNHHCHVFCNPLYADYFTTPGKDRLTIIDYGPSTLAPPDWNGEELQRMLAERIPDLGSDAHRRIVEAAALAPYHAEAGHVRLFTTILL